MIRKFHEAKKSGAEAVEVWGTGNPRREFLHVDDLADACVFLMERCNAGDIGEFVNIGTGKEIAIRDLASLVAGIVGYVGAIVLDPSKPEGTPRKLLDVSRLRTLGWQATTGLEEGIRTTYRAYREALLCS